MAQDLTECLPPNWKQPAAAAVASSQGVDHANGHKPRSKRPPKDKVAIALNALDVARAVMKQIPDDCSDLSTMDKTVSVMEPLQHAVNVLLAELGEEDQRTAHAMYLLAESFRMLYYQTKDFDTSIRLREASWNYAQRQESALEVDSQSGGSSKSSCSQSGSERDHDFDDEDTTITDDHADIVSEQPAFPQRSLLPTSRQVIRIRCIEWFYKAKRVYETRHGQKQNELQETFRLADIHTKLGEFAFEDCILDVAVMHLEQALNVLENVRGSVTGRQIRASVTFLLSKFTYAKALTLSQKSVTEILEAKLEAVDGQFGDDFRENLEDLVKQLGCGYVAEMGSLDSAEALKMARVWTETQESRLKEKVAQAGPHARPGTTAVVNGSPDEEDGDDVPASDKTVVDSVDEKLDIFLKIDREADLLPQDQFDDLSRWLENCCRSGNTVISDGNFLRLEPILAALPRLTSAKH